MQNLIILKKITFKIDFYFLQRLTTGNLQKGAALDGPGIHSIQQGRKMIGH